MSLPKDFFLLIFKVFMTTVSPTYTTAKGYVEKGPGKGSSVEDSTSAKGRKKFRKLRTLR